MQPSGLGSHASDIDHQSKILLPLCWQCIFRLTQLTVLVEALTEEEIAAFKANTQHLSIKSFRPTSQSFTGFSTFSPRPKLGNAAQNGASTPSQLDVLSSSDSDSDV